MTVVKIAEKFDYILCDYPSARIYICGDYSIHSFRTNDEIRYNDEFSIAYDLIKVVDKLIRFPDTSGYYKISSISFADISQKNAPLKNL